MSDTLHVASASDADGFDFARFVALLGIAPDSCATFSPQAPSQLSSAWEIWQENWFLPTLAPAFMGSYNAASRLKIDEIQNIDGALDAKLSAAMREKSHTAGKTFLDGKNEMKGHREWIRFTERVEAGESHGHLPVLFALQCSLFHLPLASALTAYASFEFQSREAKFPFKEMTEDENVIFSTVLPRISLAVQKDREDYSGGSDMLRVI